MKTVLLVDDMELMHDAGAAILGQEGYRTLHARDGLEAVRVARSELPSLILMDLMMPGLDGIGAARELRGDERTAGIPIVAITAAVAGVQMEDLQKEGFTGMLAKPFTMDQLLAEVRRALP